MDEVKRYIPTNFSDIQLTKSEKNLLRTLESAPAQESPLCERLIRYRLACYEFASQTPGNRPVRNGRVHITDLGKDYLAYLEALYLQRQISSCRYWITTTIAIAALIKSFLPEISVGLAALLKLLTP